MYLTKDEFLILKGLAEGLSYKEISDKFNLKIYTNDPKVGALFKKYGVKDRHELLKVADLEKVTVADFKDIPCYQYHNNGYDLIEKIMITKKDVQRLAEYFEKVDNPEKTFELIQNNDAYNMCRNLSILDIETGTEYEIHTIIDGMDYTGNV